ncbi:MAG: hypothetical protein A2161_20300 [Candidatus Schekmanbacteria bacterium RBG_13_48_7]|uniref:Uncharacterized protein n=1 Tax=Candidatus Schekmanbacteria bacterium RBG_13_48_7 TaxID=1817878 RepID=A0A1F7RKC1_9BACT|nr:MAG: hypothetical protein A2161_20300 [Candidatus Schekmanbacteria bacterium RBG_13_48_7]
MKGSDGKVFSYDGAGNNPGPYNPNDDVTYATKEPISGGKVLVYRNLPGFKWIKAYYKAVSDGIQFNSWESFRTYLLANANQKYINTSLYYELGLDTNLDEVFEEAIWYIGDGSDPNNDQVVTPTEIASVPDEVP